MRRTSEEERKLFERDFRLARPIKPVKPPAKPRKAGAGRLDGHTAQKLRHGKLAPEARLDLHGLGEAAAHRRLLLFLEGARKRGLRLVLVITGKGNPGGSDAAWMRPPHGVLKQMVPRWLAEKDFAALAAGAQPAHARHGGEGALYVYLRKAPAP